MPKIVGLLRLVHESLDVIFEEKLRKIGKKDPLSRSLPKQGQKVYQTRLYDGFERENDIMRELLPVWLHKQ